MLWHAAGVDQRLAYDEVSPVMKLSSAGTGWCEGRSPADLKRSLLSTRLTESSGEILHVEFCTMQQIHGKCGPSCFMKHGSFQLESVRPHRRGFKYLRCPHGHVNSCAMESAFPSQVYRKYEVNGIKQVLTSIFGSFC